MEHLHKGAECREGKKMSNADRIRSMTDEELDDFDSENFEVIGNIFDNPELLEV